MRTAFHFLNSLPTLGSCLVLLATLMSCNPAPMTNTVVSSAQSPDGKLSAILQRNNASSGTLQYPLQ